MPRVRAAPSAWISPNGDILLPIYFKGKEDPFYRVDGRPLLLSMARTLKYLEHGDEFELNSGRGLFEPSLTRFGQEVLSHNAQ